MGLYEGMYVLSPQLEGESLEKETDFLKNEIVRALGEITEAKVLGKRRLAYPIRRMNSGIYVLISFTSKPDTIDSMLKKTRLNSSVLRAGIFRKEAGALLNEIRD